MKYVLITNVPSPYRAKQYNLIGDILKNDFSVFYTHSDYPTTQMKWKRPSLTHQHQFLDTKNEYYLPYWLGLFIKLYKYSPKLIITSGFNLMMLTGFIYAKLFNKKHIVFTDSWIHSIRQLTFLHLVVRKIVIKRSQGFICVGKKGKQYLEYFGAASDMIFISRLSDNIEYQNNSVRKENDIIFSGQLIDRKQPLFFVEVIKEISKSIKNIKVIILGVGPLLEKTQRKLNEYNINYEFKGFVSPENVKDFYSSSKILLFPTKDDPWGMVANDALSVGVPVITTPYAGVSDDLVIDGFNGFILDLNVKLWADRTIELLTNTQLYDKFSSNAFEKIKEYSIEKASLDFVNALKKISSH